MQIKGGLRIDYTANFSFETNFARVFFQICRLNRTRKDTTNIYVSDYVMCYDPMKSR